jgi:hypothetical protein
MKTLTNPATIQMREHMQIIAERALVIGCRGGGMAYGAYILDLMKAGDRHMQQEQLTIEDITDGIWWTRWKETGEYEAVLVENPGYGDKQVVKQFGGEIFNTLDEELVDRDFICLIQEPS